jgi:hypothetical protein
MSFSKALVALGAVAAVAAAPGVAFDEPYKVVDGGAFDVSAGPIPYRIDPAGSDDISGNGALNAIHDAFRAWACVAGTSVRFRDDGDGVNQALDDGINTLFWDEDNSSGLGPGTLAQTLGDVGGAARLHADIIFNGFDHTWSVDDGPSAVDVGSIALHEIGHFIGLDHPCDVEGGQEVNCNGPEASAMTPVWDNEVVRQPLPDDEEGVRALYPASDPDARCDGPFQLGEACACDDECVEGLACVAGTGGSPVCAQLCSADDATCNAGFVCVLGAPEADESPPGACVKGAVNATPAGGTCTSTGQCAVGECSLVADLGRSVCRVPCAADDDCADGATCFGGACLIGASGIACPAADPAKGCQCSSHGTGTTTGTTTGSTTGSTTGMTPASTPAFTLGGILVAVVAVNVRRRRRDC